MAPHLPRLAITAIALTAIVASAGACDSETDTDRSATTTPAAASVNPCSLVMVAEVVEFLGVSAIGRRDGSRCEWRNDHTAELLSLTLGRTGSTVRAMSMFTPGDTLPPRSAGDGMYFVQFRAIAFQGRHRTGTIHIERSGYSNLDREAAEVRLARLVRPRLIG